MKGLTDKQKKMLDFIENFLEEQGMAPTVYEIADFFKIKTSTVFAHLRALQRKSFLKRSSKARSISLMRPKKRPRHMSFSLSVPLLGRINAGMPVDSPELREGEVYCDPSLIGETDPKKLFALRVNGESMRDLGIFDGDIIVVRQTEYVKSGDIVVALVNNETTVKSYFPLRGDKIELRPANPEFKTQTYSASEVKVQGVVTVLMRRI